MTDVKNMADIISLSSEGGDPLATAEKIEKTFLTCSICFDVYDHPKCLPCLHTFCGECLLSYIESKDMYGVRADMGFPCPICKQIVNITNYHKPYAAWLDELQNNFLIQNMIECLESSREEAVEKLVREAQNTKEEEDDDITKSPPSHGPDSPVQASFPTGVSSPSRSPQFTDTIGIPVLDLLRTFTSQYGLTQRLALEGAAGNLTALEPPRVYASVPSNPPLEFIESRLLKKTYSMEARNWADYKPPRLSDVCCLYKHNGIIVLDWDNRCVKYVKNVFMGRNVTTAFEVVGRPCNVSVLDKNTESRIVVSLLKRNKLYFLRIPDLQMINVMDTRRPYRGLTVLSPTTILAGSPWSPGTPAQIDLIRLDHRCKMVTSQTIYQMGPAGSGPDLYQPHYMASVTDKSFVVTDRRKNRLFFYEIKNEGGQPKAVKKFSLSPPDYRSFQGIGGATHHNGKVYLVDSVNHEVHKVTLGDTVQCECILKPGDDVYQPASVCVGPQGEVCVVTWDGKVSIYQAR